MSGLKALPVFERLMRDKYYLTTETPEDQEISDLKKVQLDSGLARQFANLHRVSCGYQVPDPLTDDGTLHLDKILGHTTIPYPATWIEWRMPDWSGSKIPMPIKPNIPAAALCLDGKSMLTSRHDHWKMFKQQNPDIDLETSWEMSIFTISPITQTVVQLPGNLCIALDSEGKYIGVNADLWGTLLHTEQARDEAATLLIRLGYGALQTTGWLNCRNVTTEKHTDHYNDTERLPSRNPARRKGKAVRVRKYVDYHTVKLPGAASDGIHGNGAGAGSTRLHKVRGHFKTFTKEAPLLGKHVGTYWWGYQLRGNRLNGVAVTDLEVEPRVSAD